MQRQTGGRRGTHTSGKQSHGNSITHATISECTHTHAQEQLSCKPMVTVQVSCPACSKANHINMNKLWQKENKHRFSQITCTSCQSKTRLGHWCCSHDVEKTTVKQWLQTHSYNGITFLKHEERPPTATVELFKSGVALATDQKESESTKRKTQDFTDDNAKKRRHNDTQ